MKNYVPIKLDKTRNLRYSLKALSRIEDELGCSIAGVDFSNVSIKQIITFIWAGLIHEDKYLSVDDVMDLLDDDISLDELMKKVTEAMDAAMNSMGASGKKSTPTPRKKRKK
jgi:20S proteasome alpha/beta subunit